MAKCLVIDCPKPGRENARDMCWGHYHRWLRYNHPLGGPPPRDLRAEMWGRIAVSEIGCWLYDSVSKRPARLQRDGRWTEVRALVWQEYEPPLASGERLSNECGHVQCVRPEHHRLIHSSAA